jgi:hypothetical protein
VRGALLMIVSMVVVVGCIPPRPSPSTSPAETAPLIPSASEPTSSPGTSASLGSEIAVDAALLDLLPGEVSGVPVRPDAATAAEIAGEGYIAPFVSAIAVAAAFGPQPSGTLSDYVVVTVARLRPGTFGDLFYRGWRDTFDAAVCERSGGVSAHAETDIGGRHTYIGTCQGGVHTYHVHLATASGDVMVSMQGLGNGSFAERIVAGLRE